ncbi:MAG: hypothetical protein DMD69_17730 [Gemmatimonadetes bacterium]|nr:MAG: hypothetical protein DMD69_17730 [Gemmatimonadota bacterium]
MWSGPASGAFCPRLFGPLCDCSMPTLPSPGAKLTRAVLRPLQRRADHMGMAALTYYTADMVRALPDDGHRYETVHGELLVTPAPGLEHQYVVLELAARLRDYLRIHPVGHVLISPADISWAPDVLVQPDVFVTAVAEARTFDWQQIKTLLLAIEVLSPSTSRYDRFTKRRLYQEYGVPWYWTVDIHGRADEIWTPEAACPAIEREQLVWHPRGATEPLVIPLADILPRV